MGRIARNGLRARHDGDVTMGVAITPSCAECNGRLASACGVARGND
jgi:hypothetical protein